MTTEAKDEMKQFQLFAPFEKQQYSIDFGKSYTENRSKSEALSYLNGISQKSVLIVTRKG